MPESIISDITVILDNRYSDDAKTDQAVDLMKKAGMQVDSVDYDNSVVEGTIAQAKVHELQQMDCVDYVRTTFTYYANFPTGQADDFDSASAD
ncbi:MAG TPA: hypothetical protein VFE58_18720 [Tepidisphaeraceae bacterium]|jgi:hypothetical protein|nr:hypothetical protein [Tepidisphaeraceae bacterium]